jgi:capsular exopolysaccharide synthesis family protein
MNIHDYLHLLRRWLWLIVIATFMAGGAAYLFRSQQTDQYEAQVTVSVGSFINAPNPNTAEITTGVELALTYVHLAKTYTVLEATIAAGNYPLTAKELDAALTVSAIQDTSLLKIVVSNPDPALAINLANEVARQLILNSPSNLTPQQQSQIDLADAEIQRLETQLEQERLRLTTITAQMDATTDQVELERLTEQYNTVIASINQASSTIAQFNDTLSVLQQRTNSLTIVDPARILDTSPGINIYIVTIVGAIAGAVGAWCVILVVEYLDNTIRTVDGATEALALPALAAIPRFGKRNTKYGDQLVTYREPQSPIAEEYRALRTNMMFTSNGATPHRAYVISSAGPGEGKTVTVANMAVAMAMAGWRVLLIDADLRRPRLHEFFDLDSQNGLTTLLSVLPEQLSPADTRQMMQDCLKETSVPELFVITSGYIPLNPTEVLGSLALRKWYTFIQSEVKADVVLFDTPPVLAVADAPVLASSLDVPVVMVIRAGQTRPAPVQRAKDRLAALDIEIKGFVLNAMNPRDQKDDYDQSYYYYYYRDSRATKAPHETPVSKPD